MPSAREDWEEKLTGSAKSPMLVLGVGRRGHGDDAAGPELIDRLEENRRGPTRRRRTPRASEPPEGGGATDAEKAKAAPPRERPRRGAAFHALCGRRPDTACHPGLLAIDCGSAPENFLGVVVRHRPGSVLIADAVRMGTSPGTVQLLTPEELGHSSLGTHALSPALFCRMLQAELGVPCFILAIEPGEVGPGLPLSAVLASRVERVAAALVAIAST